MPSSITNNADVQELIRFHKIQPEDYSIIENLSYFSKSELMINFHSFFTTHKDGSADYLRKLISQLDKKLTADLHDDATRRIKELSEWYLELCQKYGWITAHNINSLLQRLNNKY